MTTIIEELKACAEIRRTRVSEDIWWGDGMGHIRREPDPFYDFDRCEMSDERERALKDLEKYSEAGPATHEEALWPESRIQSLIAFSKKETGSIAERQKNFSERLTAWYVSAAKTQSIAVRAINFALEIAFNNTYFHHARKYKLFTKAIGIAVRKFPACYSQIPKLSDFLNKTFSELLYAWHSEDVWTMAADIVETVCVGDDYSFIPHIQKMLELYADGKTGRNSERNPGYVNEQKLWTAAEIAYLNKAIDVLNSVHNAQAI